MTTPTPAELRKRVAALKDVYGADAKQVVIAPDGSVTVYLRGEKSAPAVNPLDLIDMER